MRLTTLAAATALALLGLPGSTRAAPPTADALALDMMDGEALYTLTGGLKPVSEGFWQTHFPEGRDTSPEVDAARAALNALPLGPDLAAGVYVFVAPFRGTRVASAFVAHRPSLGAVVARRRDVFEPLGVTPATAPQRVLELIDRAPRATRWRAFGLVFGYPEYAVEFFVAAGEEQDAGKPVGRDFVSHPTFASDRGRFVYAVPKGHVERAEDRRLKAATADILARYRAWRAVYLAGERLGAVALLRSWLAPPAVCRPPTARADARPGCPDRPSPVSPAGPRARRRPLCR